MKTVKVLSAIMILSSALLFQTGCGPEANLFLNFAPKQSQNYKAVSQYRKDYLFDQPAEKKKTEKMNETIVEMAYSQTVRSVDAQGNANTTITIRSLKYLSKDEKSTNVNYDSSKPDSKPKELESIIGQSYEIKISPDGKVIDVSGLDKVKTTVKRPEAKRIVKGIFDKKNVMKLHTVKSLPDTAKNKVKVGDMWASEGSSPKRALVAKVFDKNYTVKDIKETPEGIIADIQLKSAPASTTADKAQVSQGAMGVFGNMFESDDSITGHLKLNLDTGEVLSYQEKFAGKYTAVQFPDNDPNGEPDMLQLGYTEMHSIEAIN